MLRNRWIIAACTALALVGCKQVGTGGGKSPTVAPTTGVTDAMIAAADGNEWLTYGRDYAEQRFSPLTQVSDKTVGQLGLAWSADLDTARGQEATPLFVDGTLYVSTAWSMVKAYDAKTGTLKWSYDPKVPRETLPVAYAAADLVVVPSLATRRFLEPWGLVCNEAMYGARPVIASAAVGAVAGGLVTHGQSGMVVRAGDEGDLVSTMRQLIEDPALRVRLGDRGRVVVGDYTYEAAAEAFGRALAAIGAI